MRSNGVTRLRGCSCRGDQAEPSEKVPSEKKSAIHSWNKIVLKSEGRGVQEEGWNVQWS